MKQVECGEGDRNVQGKSFWQVNGDIVLCSHDEEKISRWEFPF